VLCSPGLQPGGPVAASDRKLHSTNRSQNCLAQFKSLELWIAQCLSTSRAPENRNGGISDLRQKVLILKDHYLIAQFNRFQHNKTWRDEHWFAWTMKTLNGSYLVSYHAEWSIGNKRAANVMKMISPKSPNYNNIQEDFSVSSVP
jgi:hypothetical protein